MAKRNRRQAAADMERLKTLAATMNSGRRIELRRHLWLFILIVLVWAALAGLPSFFVDKPVPYMVGSTAAFDIHSRVEFTWHDEMAEAQALRNLEQTYARRYREVPLSQWAAETHVPVIQFLLRVVAAENLDEAEKAAKELNIQATDDQVASFWRGAAWARNAPNPYLVTPLKEILDNEIYARGIMDPIRFDVESGRTIQILRGDSMVTVTVGGENGPTPLSRLSETLDRRFRLRLSSWIPDDFKIALHDVVLKRLKPSLVYDETASAAGLEERRQELRLRLQTIGLNALMVTRGSIITPNILDMLQEEERVFQEKQDRSLAAVRFVGNFLLFAGIALSMVIFFRVAERDRIGFPYSRLFVVAAFCLLVVWSGYLLVLHEIPGTMLPIGLMLGIITLGTNTRSAIFLAAITSICGLILFDGRADIMMGHLGAGLFFVSAAARCRRRMPLLLVSAGSGLIGAVAFVAWNFARGNLQNLFSIAASLSLSRDDTVNPIVAAGGFVLNWSICGMLVILLIPVAERCFRVTTRIALQDLLASEHPLLKRLIVEAPGTFHHCTIVATLAEAAAAAIGADTLRARVGGLFHDIGKLKKPEYFTENEFGVSRHERLNPYMSALLIINHVLDGAEMARAIGLPYVVADMALQHHGDSLMKFFYYKACQQVPPGTVVAKESFLYPGPKPQTREAGVLMIADSIEAAARSLDDTSPKHLGELIARLIRERLAEGQFEESGLTMRDLKKVEEVLYRMLLSMFHTRVKYPGQDKDAPRKTGGKP